MPSVFVFYHFLYPDPVVSSVHFSELCESLAERGWRVTGFASNRGSGRHEVTYPPSTTWRKVDIRRFWRPKLAQNSSFGRVVNATFMISRWGLLALRRSAPDVIVMGTDPILSVLIAPIWRFFHPQTRIVHWCFDLYPEAAIADGILPARGLPTRMLKWLARHGYAACDIIVDIGSCMRELLLPYGSPARHVTLVPWAVSEPPAALPVPSTARAEIYGSAQVGLMYSGTLGRAHTYEELLELMRQLRGLPVHLAFSVTGNAEAMLRSAIQPDDTNISFVPFASASALEERLATADIQIVSLRPEWTGTVVPSKFFGALAAGRPILFCGSRHSAIARWIEEFRVGWVLDIGQSAAITSVISDLTLTPAALIEMRVHCHRIYQQHFSRSSITEAWHRELCNLLSLEQKAELLHEQT